MAYPSSAGLVTGLGNPGRRYSRTRHNIGFAALSRLMESPESGALRPLAVEKKWACELYQWDLDDQDQSWLLCRPLTYMNLSGEALHRVFSKYRLKPEQLLVVHDELDLPLGSLRLKFGGGLAGHRGLRSIVQELGSRDFYRLRLGIGRPEPGVEVIDHVLSPFVKTEMPILSEVLSLAAQTILVFRRQGFQQAFEFLRRAPGI